MLFRHSHTFFHCCYPSVLTHQNTDKIDLEITTQFALNEIIHSSSVSQKYHIEFGSYFRLRHEFVQKRKDTKNKAHDTLSFEMCHVSNVLADMSAKNGLKPWIRFYLGHLIPASRKRKNYCKFFCIFSRLKVFLIHLYILTFVSLFLYPFLNNFLNNFP